MYKIILNYLSHVQKRQVLHDLMWNVKNKTFKNYSNRKQNGDCKILEGREMKSWSKNKTLSFNINNSKRLNVHHSDHS